MPKGIPRSRFPAAYEPDVKPPLSQKLNELDVQHKAEAPPPGTESEPVKRRVQRRASEPDPLVTEQIEKTAGYLGEMSVKILSAFSTKTLRDEPLSEDEGTLLSGSVQGYVRTMDPAHFQKVPGWVLLGALALIVAPRALNAWERFQASQALKKKTAPVVPSADQKKNAT